MTLVRWGVEMCFMCGYLLDDNMECPECEICNGDKMNNQMTAENVFKTNNFDTVTKPIHYNQSGIECIDAINAMTNTMNGTSAYMAGNVLKYVWRHEYKNGLEDLEKAQVYLGWLIENYKKVHK